MQQHDDVVMGWLSGSESVGGFENPAGPLYIDNMTEKKMTNRVGASIHMTLLKTTQSCASGCDCC
jgi:hypothetical protein